MQGLFNYIERYVSLDAEAKNLLTQVCNEEDINKNDYLLEAGNRCHKLWFLERGTIRKYYLKDGREKTCWVHVDNDIFTSLSSYVQQVPSTEFIQACESSKLVSINRSGSEMLSKHPKLQLFSNKILQSGMANIDTHSREFAERDARGRFEYLRHIAPEMVKRAKLGYIADIIGVTQETLSRVRKE